MLLSLAAFASAASIRVTDALLPRLAAEFDVGIAAAASVITGFTVAYGAMQMAFGPLGDRFGKLRVIAFASGGAALATLACFAATGFHALAGLYHHFVRRDGVLVSMLPRWLVRARP